MKRRLIWIALPCLIVTSLVLASCSSSTSSSTATNASTTLATSVTTANSTTTIATSATSSTPVTTAVTTTSTGNWWDSLGTPTYGGVLTLRLGANPTGWDPQFVNGQVKIYNTYYETLFAYDWTTSPAVFNYQPIFTPATYAVGQLAQSWTMPDQNTFIVTLHQGITWQNIAPANGREFVASDVVYKFDRRYGLGSGMPGAAQNIQVSEPVFVSLLSVTATDNFTVVFKFGGVNTEALLEAILGPSTCIMECPDAVKQWGDVSNWQHAIGTGPFILTDFVDSTSATLLKNPTYWGYDERYPNNQLPYVNEVNYVIIASNATALAAMRSGKLAALDGQLNQDAVNLKKTNPDMPQVTYHSYGGLTIDPRNDVVPYNDIRVRTALQEAIDLPTIASSYYQGAVSPNPMSLIAAEVTGWGYPYSEWPQSLKDEYAYNPTNAKALLAAAGYPNGFKTDVVAASNADSSILQIVQSYFAAVGINMSITTMDPTSWVAFVQTGHKQDALAFKSVGQLGKSYQPTYIIGTFQSAGVQSADWLNVNDPVYDKYYAEALAPGNTLDQVKQYVSDVDERSVEQHYDISLLNPILYGIYEPWFHGYDGQYNAISAGSGAPASGSFYLARFWITAH